jgi:hypothetical protein
MENSLLAALVKLPRSKFLLATEAMLLLISSVIAVFVVHQFWIVLFVTILLGTRAVVPKSNPLLYWPIGFLVLLTAGYVGFLAFWMVGYSSVDQHFSQGFFTFLNLFLVGTILLRVRRMEALTYLKAPSLDRLFGVAVAVSIPLLIVIVATFSVFHNPAELIGRFLAGGDHGRHNLIIHGLMPWAETKSVATPLNLYSYPRAVHFICANALSLFTGQTHLPLLAQEYLIGAWVNWLQLAAYVQLCVTIVLARTTSRFVMRGITIVGLVVMVSTIDKYVIHLMWSGFTTSLAMTWIFLIPFAWPWNDRKRGFSKEYSNLGAISIWLFVVTWGVYQLTAVSFAAVAAVAFTLSIRRRKSTQSTVLRSKSASMSEAVSVGLIVLGAIIGVYILLGPDSQLISTLVAAGFTFNPFLPTVVGWALVANFLLMSSPLTDATTKFSLLFFISLCVMAASYALIVKDAGDFGLRDLPYYVTKLLWIVLFVSVPVACAFGLERIEMWSRELDVRRRFTCDLVVLGSVLFVPLALGRSPFVVSRYTEINWFAQEMVEFGSIDLDHSTAFSGTDALGAHVANLALKSRSSINMPQDLEFSLKPYLACQFINSEPVETVFTDEGGRFVLLDAGCDPMLRYVEPSRVFEPAENDSQ